MFAIASGGEHGYSQLASYPSGGRRIPFATRSAAGKRHPAEMGKAEIEQFLTALAVDRHVAASTQNQALAALLFLYKDVLECDPGWLDDVVRAKRPARMLVTKG